MMISSDRLQAIEAFRVERLGEPTELYHEVLNRCQTHFENLLELTVDLTSFPPSILAELFRPELFRALRYTAGPPVSSDDLRVLADVESVGARSLINDVVATEKVLEVILRAFDRERFPWLSDRPVREASDLERDRAIFASAAILASTQMGTARRHLEGSKSDSIATGLLKLGLKEAAKKSIESWADVPEVGTFVRKARIDRIVDGRRVQSTVDFLVRTESESVHVVMCRVSNSALNSRRRLLKEVVPVTLDWKRMLGPSRVQTAVVLGGVFDEETLIRAQSNDLRLFWFHDLPELSAYLVITNSPQSGDVA